MTHYVLMKYKQGYLSDKKFEDLSMAFSVLCGQVDGISGCTVKRNAVKRETNMDVMVSFRVLNENILREYLAHPLHLEIAKENDPYIERRISFDCE